MTNRPKIRFADPRFGDRTAPRVRVVGFTSQGSRVNHEWMRRDEAIHHLYMARLQDQVDAEYSHLLLEIE